MVRTRSKTGHVKTVSETKKDLIEMKATQKGKREAAIRAQAEIPQKVNYSDEFMQVSKVMETMNRTLAEMNRGLTSRLDGLTERMDKTEINTKLAHESAESDRKLTNVKLEELAKLLEQSEVDGKIMDKKLKETEMRLAAADSVKKHLVERINYLENRTRITNILIDGRQENDVEDLGEFMRELSGFLTKGKTVAKNIVATYRIGKKQTQQADNINRIRRPRTIKVAFDSLQARNEVYYARATLKQSQVYKGIYITDDVTLDTKKARENYRSVAALARTLKTEVKLHDDGIILEGRKYRLFDEESLPSKFSMKKAKTIEVRGAVYFHSEYSYLSNFFHSPMLIDEVLYMTAEHRLQYMKCKATNDLYTAARITAAPTALDAKRLGDNVRETPEWRLNRDKILEEIIITKFEQNETLKKELLMTGEKKLFEATASQHFGIGAGLHSREVRDGTHSGENVLGRTLESVRNRWRDQNKATR